MSLNALNVCMSVTVVHVSDLHVPGDTDADVVLSDALFRSCAYVSDRLRAMDRAVLLITGDVFDKALVRAQSVQVLSRLLDLLCVVPTIMIPGNHDLSKSGARTDMLQEMSVLGALRWPLLRYMRDGGVVSLHGVEFEHVAAHEDGARARGGSSPRVILYHGGESAVRAMLAGVEGAGVIACCGDYHAYGLVDAAVDARYAGSLVPLHFHEGQYAHGAHVAVWDGALWRHALMEVPSGLLYTERAVSSVEEWRALPADLLRDWRVGASVWRIKVRVGVPYDVLGGGRGAARASLLRDLSHVGVQLQVVLQSALRCPGVRSADVRRSAEGLPSVLDDGDIQLALQVRGVDLSAAREAMRAALSRSQSPTTATASHVVLERLECENFASFARASLLFASPLLVLEGANGAGKSNVIDALLWCLYGQTPRQCVRRFTQSSLIRDGASSATVSVHMRLDDEPCVVRRSVQDRAARSKSVLEVRYRGRILRGKETLDAFVERHVGGMSSFLSSHCMVQHVRGALEGTPKERADTLLRRSVVDGVSCLDMYELFAKTLRGWLAEQSALEQAAARDVRLWLAHGEAGDSLLAEMDRRLQDLRAERAACMLLVSDVSKPAVQCRWQALRAGAELVAVASVDASSMARVEAASLTLSRSVRECDVRAYRASWSALAEHAPACEGAMLHRLRDSLSACTLDLAACEAALSAWGQIDALDVALQQLAGDRDRVRAMHDAIQSRSRDDFLSAEARGVAAARQVALYSSLLAVLSRQAVVCALLRRSLPFMCATMNELLETCTDYSVSYNVDADGSLDLLLDDGRRTCVYEQLSGFQRNMVDLSYRHLLLMLGGASGLQLAILDEPLTSVDAVNAPRVARALQFMAARCGGMLLITHVDALSAELSDAARARVARDANGVSHIVAL